MEMITIFGLDAPVFEIIMLVCFGCAWPISIIKSAKSRSTGGKSIVFSFIILAGYISGLINKMVVYQKFDIACPFYMLNCVMVSIDAILWFRNRKLEKIAANNEAMAKDL